MTAAKRAVLSAMAEAVGSSPMGLRRRSTTSCSNGPNLSTTPACCAAVDRFGVDWRAWPGPLRGGLLRWSDVDPVNFRYHIYAQWVAREQVVQLSEPLSQRGQVLSLDLPVGIHPNGYDVWRRREQYATDVSVGAPPDTFFAQGQSWGFPPSRPEALRESGHCGPFVPPWPTTCVWPGCCASTMSWACSDSSGFRGAAASPETASM